MLCARRIKTSGASRHGALEFGDDTVGASTLERLHYGARLAERTGRPILVSGSIAETMAETLESGFQAPVRFVEPESRNTHQNAVLSARLLAAVGIRRVYVVTHFWHMPRAMAAFEAAGLEPVAAPLGFSRPKESVGATVRQFLPGAHRLGENRELLHEWIGRLWYRLRYGY